MEQFVGKAILLEVKDITLPDKSLGQGVQKTRYTFLVANKTTSGFLTDVSVERYISDLPVPMGEKKLYDEINVGITLRKYKEKVGDRYVDAVKPSYIVLPDKK